MKKIILSSIIILTTIVSMAQITGETCIKTDGTVYPYHINLPNDGKLKDYPAHIYSTMFTFYNIKAQTQYYTLQSSDVELLKIYDDGYFIYNLTEQGEQNIKDTSIIIPEKLDGKKIIGIASKYYGLSNIDKGLFANKNLKSVKLPKTIEYIGDGIFANNKNMALSNFKELVNLKYIGIASFMNIKDIDNSNSTHRLNCSNLSKLERIGLLAFAHDVNGFSINTVDFTNCSNLESIGMLAFERISANTNDKTLDSLILKNCVNLSYIGDFSFTTYLVDEDSIHQQNIEKTKIDFSGCKLLLYWGNHTFGVGINNFSYIGNLLPSPQINNLTFNSWKEIYNANSICYIAQFDEYVISIREISNNIIGLKNSSKTYQALLTTINQQQNKKDETKSVTFQITNHSITDVEISNIVCSSEYCTLSWQSGTIKSGETQKVTVTYPDTTTNYTATINIEGENLMGNTTVNVGKNGSVTTDDNLLSSIEQQEILKKDDITVYPNPATDELHIKLENPQATNQITILNLQGKTVYENLNFKGSVINISKLPPAVYVMKVNGAVKSFVKQ